MYFCPAALIFARNSTHRALMNVEAKITKEWKKRMFLMFAFFFAFGLWFLYDGYVGYPKEAKRFEIYDKFRESLVAEGKMTREMLAAAQNASLEDAWRTYALSQGIERTIPSDRTDADFLQQKKIGLGTIIASFFILGWVFWSSSKVLRANDSTIFTIDGKEVPFDSITAVDRKKWDKKGIAYILYPKEGKTVRATLDDYKYGGAEEILLEVERRLAAKNPVSSEPKSASPAASE